jgi:hypothetical protein
MIKIYFTLFFVALSLQSMGQDTVISNEDSLIYSWNSEHSFPLGKNDIWSVDKLNNVYVTDGEFIRKYDSTGNLKFQQSIKSFGDITQLVPVNTFKLISFSQEQQSLCFLDNTLTATEDCIDLVDYTIYNAEWIATSTRPELLWVYDNVNSTLKLISLNTIGEVNLEIVNVRGILGLNEVDQLFEEAQNLYILDKVKGVFQMDFYGGLLNSWPISGALRIEADADRHLFRLQQNTLEVQGLFTDNLEDSTVFRLPQREISDLRVIGKYIYFRTPKTVHKYRLLFGK